ncbi:Oxygen tolerance [Filimonas lacunae]|uniref:Oxygen tolerance n=1 Tax=Filimonas lacunae TaxID=477680 RepID=A0A1N7MBK4_9BACT|nr:BatD family protein [Filimonas lacunae]SIS83515.1 Oxygen tolerance [Filimonas lacunae]
MKYFTCICYSLLLLFTAHAQNAQVHFTIQTSAHDIFKNDVLQVEYVISNASWVSDFIPPSLNAWSVSSGPIQSEETVNINGKSTHKSSFIYMLRPLKAGTLTLPSASVVANNRRVSSNSITIHVIDKNNPSPIGTPPPSAALQSLFGAQSTDSEEAAFSKVPELREQENATDKIRSNSFIKVFTSKNTCYIGEPVMVTYKFYRALRSKAVVTKQPSFSGCSVKEIAFDEQSTQEKYGNKTYIVNVIRKVQLQPLQAGRLRLDSATVTNEIVFALPHKQYAKDNFRADIQNMPQFIEVLPLPKQNKPQDFTGITGHFRIQAQAKDNNIPAQENNSLLITISGKGDITGIKPPAVNWPGSTEHFEATTEDNIDKNLFPLEGSRTFAYHFIASKEGDITIPPVQFSYFDVEKERYESIHTDSLHLHFNKPAGKKDYTLFAEEGGNKNLLWMIVAALLAGGAGAWWYYRRKPKKPSASKTKPQAQTIPPARPDFIISFDILSNIEDHYLFFNKSKDILSLAIGEKTNTYNVPFPVLLTALQQHEQYAHLVTDCKLLYEDCDVAMYSPDISSSDRANTLDRMKKVLQQLRLIP